MKHSQKTSCPAANQHFNAVADSRCDTDSAKTAGARNEALGSEVEKKITAASPKRTNPGGPWRAKF
jgi:hypothetical protein